MKNPLHAPVKNLFHTMSLTAMKYSPGLPGRTFTLSLFHEVLVARYKITPVFHCFTLLFRSSDRQWADRGYRDNSVKPGLKLLMVILSVVFVIIYPTRIILCESDKWWLIKCQKEKNNFFWQKCRETNINAFSNTVRAYWFIEIQSSYTSSFVLFNQHKMILAMNSERTFLDSPKQDHEKQQSI